MMILMMIENPKRERKWGGGTTPDSCPSRIRWEKSFAVGRQRERDDRTRRIDEHAPGGVIGQRVACLRILLLCRSPLRFTEGFLPAQELSLFPQAFSGIADELPPGRVGVNSQVGVGSSSVVTPLLFILLSQRIGVVCLTPRFSYQV